MNKQRLVILAIAVLGMLAVFMPWVTMPIIGSVNGAHGEGWAVFILYAIPAILAVLNDRTKPLEGIWIYGAIVPGLICSAIAIWKIIEFNSAMGETEDNPFAAAMGASISIGLGLYLVVLAGIAITAAAFLVKEKKQAE